MSRPTCSLATLAIQSTISVPMSLPNAAWNLDDKTELNAARSSGAPLTGFHDARAAARSLT
eukprot:scaffold2393_cov267-Pinguiococcus_pyrenoidosus.AAC.16